MSDHLDGLSEEHRLIAVACVKALSAAPMPASAKRMAIGGGTGLLAIVAVAWSWASAQTALTSKHEEILVGAPGAKSLPAKVDEIATSQTRMEQASVDRDRRLGSIETKVDSIADRVGAKK